jgi:hypothetical protein
MLGAKKARAFYFKQKNNLFHKLQLRLYLSWCVSLIWAQILCSFIFKLLWAHLSKIIEAT